MGFDRFHFLAARKNYKSHTKEQCFAWFSMEMSGKTGFKLDENGNRLITLEAICRENWLHHGQIRMKRLMSIFSIKSKKSKERENFLEITPHDRGVRGAERTLLDLRKEEEEPLLPRGIGSSGDTRAEAAAGD